MQMQFQCFKIAWGAPELSCQFESPARQHKILMFNSRNTFFFHICIVFVVFYG